MIQAAQEELMTRFSINLKEKVCTVFTDGAVAARLVVEFIFGTVTQILCLEHAKRESRKEREILAEGQ